MGSPNGFVLWSGPSPYDGAPIAVVATGVVRPSANTKTGGLIQCYAFRTDVHPSEARRDGGDRAICGDCPRRWSLKDAGQPADCYVRNDPVVSIWRAYHRGNYPHASADDVRQILAMHPHGIRLGSYGNPSVMPLDVGMLVRASGAVRTGYVHDWATCDQGWRGVVMASVDSPSEARDAAAKGWRYFRVEAGEPHTQPDLQPGEVWCPADRHEHVTCADCKLCDGCATEDPDMDARPNVVIRTHGIKHKRRKPADNVVPLASLLKRSIERKEK